MKTWKKLVCGLLAVGMLCSLAGCANDNDTPGGSVQGQGEALEKAHKEIAKKHDAARDDGRKVKPDKTEAAGDDVSDEEDGGDAGSQSGVAEEYEFETYNVVYGFDGALLSYMAEQGYADRNFLVSPVSFRAALCLAIAGAGSETRAALLSAAGFDDMAAMEAWAGKLGESVDGFAKELADDGMFASSYGGEAPDRAYKVLFSVWNNKDVGAGLKQTYVDYVTGTLGSSAREESAEDITAAIDEWAGMATDGLIPSMGSDFSAASAVLANAVYLRSGWVEPFRESATKDEVFHAADGSEREMAMMNMTDGFMYGEYDEGRYLAVPMEGGKYFVARLGDRIELDPAAFTAALADMRKEKVRLTMPKLDMETTWDNGELTGYLAAHSATMAMHPDYADFTNMSEGKWYIDQIVQRARLKTDEDGLEAAAVTMVQMAVSALAPADETEPVEFRMDAPFSFVVLSGDISGDPEDLLVLFAGQFTGIG